MFAVMGITGQVGAAVADALLASGEQVRAVVRNPEKAAAWKSRGVGLATADYDDASALEAAFRGVDGAFVMIPPQFAPSPDFRESKTTIATIARALNGARPPKAVYLSSIGAQQTSGLGLITALHLLEEAFTALPISGAFLRAGWFMENFAWDVAPALKEGKLFSYLQPLDKTFPMVATVDIGKVGADVLRQSWSGDRFIEIEGPRRYSPNQIAATLESVLERRVEAIAVPRSSWVKTFVEQGTPEDRTALRVEMLDRFNSGWIDFGVAGAEHVEGSTELRQVIQQLASRT
jgi:uncharacterized protein YbjT (DUF2867 family)